MGQDHPEQTDTSPSPVPVREGAHPLPTPVRASMADEKGEPGAGSPAPSEVALEVDGASWVAGVDGMTRSGAGAASAPILLLRFQSRDPEAPGPREAWVVGRSLADLTDLQLEAAFRRSTPIPEAWARKSLFPEAGSRTGKDG